MITEYEFLYNLKEDIEFKEFKIGFMGFGGNKIVWYTGTSYREKYVPKTIEKIYKNYLKNIEKNSKFNQRVIYEIHSIILNTLKTNSFSRSETTKEYYRYLLFIIEFFCLNKLNKKLSIKLETNSSFEYLLSMGEKSNNHTIGIINENLLNALIVKAPRWISESSPLDDAKSESFNFAIPERLRINQLIEFNRSNLYRFIINKYGVVIFGHENNISFGNNQNIAFNGIKVASHSGLNDYQSVIAAGQVSFDATVRQFTKINNASGHYKPDRNSCRLAKILFHYYFPSNMNQGCKIEFIRN